MSQFVRLNVNALDEVEPALFNLAINNMIVSGHGKFTLDATKKNIHVAEAIGDRKSDEVDCVLMEDGNETTIGFKFGVGENKNLQIRGDFWRTGFQEKSFTDLVAQNYTATKIHVNEINNSKRLINRSVRADGAIVLRYAM